VGVVKTHQLQIFTLRCYIIGPWWWFLQLL